MTISSAEEFIRLRYSSNSAEYGRAANDTALPEIWREVIDRYPEARFWVAQNKTVPIAILEVLAGDPDPRVRRMVADKGKLTADLLVRLAGDDDDAVRMSVACHRNTPRAVLEGLRADPWSEIRAVIEKRIRT